MNQLFLNNKKGSLLIIFIGLLLLSFQSSGTSNNDDFAKLCEASDAYLLYAYRDVTYQKNWSRFKKFTSIERKLVVNTSKGVEDYAFLNLNDYESNHLEKIKVRTLKSDGTVVELDSSLVFKRTSEDEKFGFINYPIPAVEPGDTIETTYVYYENLRQSDVENYIDLYSDLPSYDSQYTVKTGSKVAVRYKSYNDFPKPEVVKNDSLVYIRFAMENIKGIQENDLHCLPCDKPYVYYTLEDEDAELKTWKDVYNAEFNFLTQPIALDSEKSSYYKRWKRDVLGTAKDSSKFHKFYLLYDEVLNNFEMAPLNEDEFIKSTGFFLNKGRFDSFSIRRFYRQILEDLEIDYFAIFGRDKRLGPIDKNLIRNGEFGHIFFAFIDEAGRLKLLYPHTDYYKYQIDEIPTSLYSTEAVLVKPFFSGKKKKKDKFINSDLEFAEVDSVAVNAFTLPGMSPNHNYIQQTIFSKADIENKEVSFKYRFKASGGLSTELRSFFEMLNKDEEANTFYDALIEFEGNDNTIEIDTVSSRILNAKKPFAYTMNGTGTLNNVVTFINDSLVSVSIDKLIQHNEIDMGSDSSELNYYLDYSYSDFLLFNLEFPCPIEVLGIEESNVDFKNDFSAYTLQLSKLQNNQLKILSNYKILKTYIPNDKFDAIKALEEQLQLVKNKRLIVKLKPI